MGEVVDGPWQGVDLDAVDDDLLPEVADPYGHEVELYRPVRRPSEPGAVLETKSARASYAIVWHLVHLPKYLWKVFAAFFRGAWVATPTLYRFYRVMSKHETAWIAKNAGQTAEARKAEDAQRILFWFRLITTVVALGAVLYFGSTRIGLWFGSTQAGFKATLYAMGAVATLTLIIIGARVSEQPIIDGPAPRQRGELTQETIDASLTATGILPKPTAAEKRSGIKPEGVHIAMLPRYEDGGVEVVFDLPASCGKGFEDVRKVLPRLAAHYATPATQLMLEPGMHEAQVRMWRANGDPFDPKVKVPNPLLDVDSWSVFHGAPYGLNPRRQDMTVPIVGTHFLIGALPNMGKTMAGRDIAAPVILDPFAKLFIFDGKMGKDWKAASGVAEIYEAGPFPRQSERLRDLLVRLIAEGDEKFQRMGALPDEDCPENKITPDLHQRGFAFHMLIVDECHRHLADEQFGEEITDLLIRYVQGYRAIGGGLMLLTQRPDGKTSAAFAKLRDVIGSRLALHVIDWRTSNMILGDQMNTRGFDASLIKRSQLGTGIFRADMDADGQADKLAYTVRSYYMDNADWSRICRQGEMLRREYDIVDAEVIEVPTAATVEELVLAVIHEYGTPVGDGERGMEPAVLRQHLTPFIPDLPADAGGQFGRWLNKRRLGSVKRGGRNVVLLPSNCRPLGVPHPSEWRPGGRGPDGGRTPSGWHVDATSDGTNEDI